MNKIMEVESMGDMGIFKRLKLIIPDMYDSNLNKRVSSKEP